MSEKKKINIGFDIGITSVGWSIIDEDLNIIDMGVRLFDDPTNPKDGTLENVKRRSARTSRRRLRRQRTRKDAYINFLVKNKWIDNADEIIDFINVDINEFDVDNPIELRVKALKEKISKEALIFILFHYIHHRGYFYLTEEDLANQDLENQADHKLLPSERILAFYKENGYYKDSSVTSSISAFEYVNEIEQILKVQGVEESFTKGYIEIFKSVRDFSQGPGSIKSPTKYGLYQINSKGEVEKKYDNLWDKTIGKCTYYPEEYRGLKASPKAELFNLFNDLNNIYLFNDRTIKLPKEAKIAIFSQLSSKLTSKKSSNLTLKLIKDECNKLKDLEEVKEDNISGYRVETSKEKTKPIFTEIKNFGLLVNYLFKNKKIKDTNILNLENLEMCTDLFNKLAKENDVNKRLEILNKEIINNEELNKALLKDLKGLSRSHSLSYKAMDEFIQHCTNHLDENINQMQFFSNKLKNGSNSSNKAKYIKTGLFDDEVISPTARRAFNQNIKVMNKILKIYGKTYDIDNITFELAREKNTKDQREAIKKSQEANKKELESILDDNDKKDAKDGLNSAQRLRLVLWQEQKHQDIYDGQEISFADVLSGKGLDIDHIIPISISSVDARYNKVLTKSYNNKEKSNDTPYQWLSRKGKYEAYKDRVLKIYEGDNYKRKREFLLYELDPLKHLDGFIERNLVDTRYASRVVLNTFQDFFKNHNLYKNVKIKVINGSLTNFARYNLLTEDNKVILHKNRDIYCHHAIDASIVCYLGMNHSITQIIKWFSSVDRDFERDNESKTIYNKTTGEKIDICNWIEKEKSKKVKDFALQLASYNDYYDNKSKEFVSKNKVKFSRQLVQRNNIQLTNETLYSFKKLNDKEGVIISKINLIEKDWDTLQKLFDEDGKNKDKLICFNEDKILYSKLQTIWKQFQNGKINPFISYMQQEYNIKDPKFILIDNQKIINLRCYGDKKDMDNVLVIKNKNPNQKKKIARMTVQDSFKSLGWSIYKNDSGKYVIIGIDQRVVSYNHKTSKLYINPDKQKVRLANCNISNKEKIDIYKGSVLIDKDNKLFYISGAAPTNNKFEIKSLQCINTIINLRTQHQISLTSLIENYKLAEVDELGNLYNIRKMEL